MLCSNCSRQISDEAKFCTFCGAKVSQQTQQQPPAQPPAPAPYYAPQPAPAPQPQPVQSYQAPAPQPAPQPTYSYSAPSPQQMAMPIPPPLTGVLQINFEESLQAVFGAGYQDKRSAMDEDGPTGYNVILVASNQRLMIYQTLGLLKKSYQQMESLALEQIQEITVQQGMISRNFTINFVRNGILHALALNNPYSVDQSNLKSTGNMDLMAIKSSLDALIAARKRAVGLSSAPPAPQPPPAPAAPSPAPTSAPAPSPVVVPVPVPEPAPAPAAPEPAPAPAVQFVPPQPGTFAELRYKMNMAGFDVKTIRCGKCGGLIFLPDQGTNILCANCQNNITAKEIIDRAREALR